MKIYNLAFFIFFFIYQHNLLAQKTVVKGVVKEDSTFTPISFANVIIYKSKEKQIVSFQETDSLGKYNIDFQADSLTTYDISVMSIGHKSVRKPINNLEGNRSYREDFLLKPDNEIESIEIKADIPIKKNGDTITYKASSFQNGSEKTLGDLLQKMPGLDVQDDGNIYFNNKKIDKLLIEGSNLFGGNYSIGTKNIPSNLIGNLEIIENYQENSPTNFVKDGKETVLNIKLKKGIKTKFFGDVSTSYGLKNFREWQSNIFSLAKNTKLYFITHHNNIGFEPIQISAQDIINNIPQGNKVKEV
ncbi:MAG: hypothetical protein SFU27_01575, partial [Thermonemataceae bacterium]|nr:hypothetical protein [Thermonemataceae bacterium]